MNTTSFWDKAAVKYAKSPISNMAGYIETRDRMRDILQPHHRVLELGCGTGSTALELADHVDCYTGADISPKMIAIAQAKQTDDALPHLSFMVNDAAVLPEGPYDVILALNLLHLLPDLQDVLCQIYAALPPSGIFIAKTGLLKDGSWFLPWVIPVMRAIGKAPYVNSFGGNELLDMLRKAGFSVTETLTQDGIAPTMFTVASKR